MTDIFARQKLKNLSMSNGIIRSATFEGMCDGRGVPTEKYAEFYNGLSKEEIGLIIAGFVAVSKNGGAMHPGQGAIFNKEQVEGFKRVTQLVHENGAKIALQIAHTGRQTKGSMIGETVVGVSTKKSVYFREKPRVLKTDGLKAIAEDFGKAALNAKKANFDAVQIHAAHGYLIHQTITPAINNRKDEFGIDPKTKIGTQFLKEVIENVRSACGDDYLVLIKISWSDDFVSCFKRSQFISLIQFLDRMPVDGIEISYGTMDYPISIFRGDIPSKVILKHNPIFGATNVLRRILWYVVLLPFFKSRVKPFERTYNLDAAYLAKKFTTKPIISVGGFRTGKEILDAFNREIDFVSLCRPLLCEPSFVTKIRQDNSYESKCVNCNLCAIMCDSKMTTRCYK